MTGPTTQVLAFEAGGQSLAIATAEVAEVVRMPPTTRVPQAPEGLQGLANLRGRIVPILSVAALLGASRGPPSARVIVLRGEDPVGLAVDRVRAMHDIAGGEAVGDSPADRVETEAGPTRLLQRATLMALAFAGFGTRCATARSAANAQAEAPAADADDVAFLQFELAGQAFALPLEQARQVLLAPPQATVLPQTQATMLGVMPLGGDLLPLISMRALLGLPPKPSLTGDRVIVASLGEARLGLVVDQVRAILRARARDVGPVPSVLNRGAGEARIDAIVRSPAGLVSVLATERIFIEDTVAQIIAEGGGRETSGFAEPEGAGAMEQFVLFRLADEAYGLPIAAVLEVVRLPETVARVPRAPDFVAGVMNHRGKIVPLIDQRRRFAVDGEATSRARRVIVAQIDDLTAGFIVDAVERILHVPASALSPAPDLAASDAPLFDRVATLDIDGRLILLVDPRQLLDQADRDVVRDVARRSNARPA